MEKTSINVVCREQYGLSPLKRDYLQSSNGHLLQTDKSPKHTSIIQIFRAIFLPQGYPDSVSKDYAEYQLWDTVQAFASSMSGAFATHSLLHGMGVGDDTATVVAATVTWMLKDGTGKTTGTGSLQKHQKCPQQCPTGYLSEFRY